MLVLALVAITASPLAFVAVPLASVWTSARIHEAYIADRRRFTLFALVALLLATLSLLVYAGGDYRALAILAVAATYGGGVVICGMLLAERYGSLIVTAFYARYVTTRSAFLAGWERAVPTARRQAAVNLAIAVYETVPLVRRDITAWMWTNRDALACVAIGLSAAAYLSVLIAVVVAYPAVAVAVVSLAGLASALYYFDGTRLAILAVLSADSGHRTRQDVAVLAEVLAVEVTAGIATAAETPAPAVVAFTASAMPTADIVRFLGRDGRCAEECAEYVRSRGFRLASADEFLMLCRAEWFARSLAG